MTDFAQPTEAPPEPVETPPDAPQQQPEQDPNAQPQPEPQPQPEQQPEWQRQFSDPDAMWKSLRDTQAKLTQTAQERAELQRQYEEAQQWQQDDPWSALPPSIDETTQQQIAAYAQRDPAAAAQWAYQHYNEVGPEVAGQLFQYWQQRDYWSAEAWKAEQLHAQWRQAESQRLEQELQPVRDYTHRQMSELTLNIASQTIPNWDHWMPRVVEFLEQPQNAAWVQALNATGVDSQAAAERLYDIYAVLHARDQRGRAPAPQQQPAPQPGAQTETANTADGGQPRAADGTFITDPGRRQGRLSHI
jgi:hypothetical protein